MLILRSLAGSSLLALMAGTAFAQVTNVGTNRSEIQDDGQDNKAQVDQSAEGNDRNTSLVRFNSSGQRAIILQIGDDNASRADQFGGSNSSTLRQFGFRNSATLYQVGTGNGSSIDQYLDPGFGLYGGRVAVVTQRGNANSSSVVQVNADNTATVRQGWFDGQGASESNGGVSTIYQYSSGNVASVTMAGGSPDAANRSHVEQTRIDPIVTNNNATVNINGSFNLSYLYQVGVRNVATHTVTGTQNTIVGKSYGNSLQSSVVQEGYRNFATVNQFAGDRNFSSIEQRSGGDRQVYVSQGGSDNSSTVLQDFTQNAAVVNQQGAGTVSSISQNGVGNFARASLLNGSVDALNKSSIVQRARNFDESEARHLADVSIRGLGNESSMTQNGTRHVASVDMAGGGFGTDEAGRRRGNNVTIVQNRDLLYTREQEINGGAGHTARVQVGLLQGGGVGTVTSIDQLGQHETIGNEAVVRQDGQYDRVSVFQSTRFSKIDGGAAANVSARGLFNQVSVVQYGREFATITQGFGRESTFTATQYDSAGSRFAEAFYAGGRGNNSIVAAQYGDRNRANAGQEGSDNSANIWQKIGSSDNSINIVQGLNNGVALGEEFSCFTRCQFARNATASTIQAGRFNSTTTFQYGSGANGRVEQNGTGTGELRNIAKLTQYYSTNAEATILQTANVGPSGPADPASGASGDPSYFAGGARSAEARIRQVGGAGLSGRIEQRGRGQYGFIDQSGSNNFASILQDVNATNATAIITQSGSGNSYNVVQSQPGQYINVSQTGTNNAVTNVVTRP